jgi:peptidoglycan/xylan/chitin deacetylase (PgdA/CDA1 family)
VNFFKGLVERSVYANHLVGRIAPRLSFRAVNRWPGDRLPWTDAKGAVTISFDCDTERDVAAFPAILDILSKHGVRASFAVIGSLLRESPDSYRTVLDGGHELFCHGNSRHTSTDGTKYHSDLFYEELSWEEIESEVERSRAAIMETLGVEPLGFRTPHFGTFQRREQVDRLFRILERHNLRYSSSLLMWHARSQDRLGASEDVIEFPLSTSVGPPISIIDSWNMIIRDRERGRPPRLERAFFRALREVRQAASPVYLNVYFDPSHVFEYPPFDRMIAAVATLRNDLGVWVGTYKQAWETYRR